MEKWKVWTRPQLLVTVCFCRESQSTPGKAESPKTLLRFEPLQIGNLKICGRTHFASIAKRIEMLNSPKLRVSRTLDFWTTFLLCLFADFCRPLHNKTVQSPSPKIELYNPFFSPIPRTATWRHFLLRKTSKKF